LLIDNWGDHAPVAKSSSLRLEAGRSYDIRIEFYENEGGAVAKLGWSTVSDKMLAEAVEAARISDAAIVCVGLSKWMESEGFDRESLELPVEQANLIREIARANAKTIVVLNSGAPVLMDPWINSVPALIEAWYPGQEGGNAIADIIFGDVDPSGKLPVTFLKRWEDSPAFTTYPGSKGVTHYEEGIFVGYRHFDTKEIKPLFPFGHGLSYTKFKYDDLEITPADPAVGGQVRIGFDIQNTGSREGAEVVQVYVRDVASSVPRPAKELKEFRKVNMKPGEKRHLVFILDNSALAFYSVHDKRWIVEPGNFEVMIGSSSRDIRLRKSIEVR